MARYFVTRKRFMHENIVVDAPSAAEAKRMATTAATEGRTHTWLASPENWSTQKQGD